jgi:hypothetical protein
MEEYKSPEGMSLAETIGNAVLSAKKAHNGSSTIEVLGEDQKPIKIFIYGDRDENLKLV